MIINGATRGMRRRHGTGPEPAWAAGSSVGNAASSALVMRGCWRGSSRKYRHQTRAQKADTTPSATKENRQENQVMSRATIGADVPAPSRPAAWVMPTAVPRAGSEVHFDSARVAAGKVAPSPMPSTKRTAKSDHNPVTAPVAMVVSDHTTPQTVSVRRAPKRSANQPPTNWNGA